MKSKATSTIISKPEAVSIQLILEPLDNTRLVNLCGQLDEHLRLIERRLAVQIANRSNHFKITGKPEDRDAAASVLQTLYEESAASVLDPQKIHLFLHSYINYK